MKVQEIMSVDVGCCGPMADLAAAAMLMWDKDCGAVPVVDVEKKVIGMLTDRDICMALATRDRLASDVTVGEVMSREVRTCAPDDDVADAMRAMEQGRLRRLPVVAADGMLVGVLSINDIILHAEKGKSKKGRHIPYKEAMSLLKAIGAHRSAAQNADDVQASVAAAI